MKTALLIPVLLAGLVAVAPARGDEEVPTITDQSGCRIYNPNPQPNETVKWNGECKSGYADGEGVLEWSVDGRLEERYEGSMRNGWAEGSGTFTSRQGMRYKGDWKRSLQEGKGVSQSADGSSYEGEWHAGKPHGWGVYRSPEGETLEGEWENGEIKSESKSRKI
jgi:hypothetical protein